MHFHHIVLITAGNLDDSREDGHIRKHAFRTEKSAELREEKSDREAARQRVLPYRAGRPNDLRDIYKDVSVVSCDTSALGTLCLYLTSHFKKAQVAGGKA